MKLTWGTGGGGGGGREFLGIIGGVVQLGSDPGSISDHSMNFFGILFQTFKIHTHFTDLVSRIHTRFCKIHTPFQTFRPKCLKHIPIFRSKQVKHYALLGHKSLNNLYRGVTPPPPLNREN